MKCLSRWIAIVIAVLVVAFAIGTAFPPARINPPEDAAMRLDATAPITADMVARFDRACGDCHTNRTRWPGYSRVAPVSWLVVHDVNDGREKLNFSDWGRYDDARKQKLLAKICEDVREGEMPPWYYLLMHADAKVSAADVAAICGWADSTRGTGAATPAASPAASPSPAVTK